MITTERPVSSVSSCPLSTTARRTVAIQTRHRPDPLRQRAPIVDPGRGHQQLGGGRPGEAAKRDVSGDVSSRVRSRTPRRSALRITETHPWVGRPLARGDHQILNGESPPRQYRVQRQRLLRDIPVQDRHQ